MGIVFYDLAGADPVLRFSPHCWKTRMALAHKGLDAQTRPWRFHETEAIAFSGQARVPVMLDGETVITDSWRIALHLEQAYPDRPALFGDASAVALAGFVNAWTDGALSAALSPIILRDIYDCIAPEDRDYFRRSREQRFGRTLEDITADRAAHLAALDRVLIPLRTILGSRDFLSGAAPAYADYCVFGAFMWAHCVSTVQLTRPDDPVSAWRARMSALFGGLAQNAVRAGR